MKRARIFPYVVSVDKTVLIAYLLLAFMGVLTMLNITSVQGSMGYFYKHLAYLALAMLAAFSVVMYPGLDKLKIANIGLVIISCVLLIMVLLIGKNVKGATRMLQIGPLSFQPSFLARLALVFYFASYMEKRQDEIRNKNLLQWLDSFKIPVGLAGIMFALILIGKHLSTLIIGGATLLGMLFYAGMRTRFIALALVLGILGGVVILNTGDGFRKQRMEIYRKYNLFIRSEATQQNTADDYQVRESLTALSSGGIFGVGIARGRAKHYYLPEARTDYIFTVIGEELGFLGAFIVLFLHCLLFFKSFRLAEKQENTYYRLLCAGLAMNIFFNALVNIGVSISIIPPTGNTLPFVSYGGSALLMDSIGVGVILNISASRRYV